MLRGLKLTRVLQRAQNRKSTKAFWFLSAQIIWYRDVLVLYITERVLHDPSTGRTKNLGQPKPERNIGKITFQVGGETIVLFTLCQY